MYEFKLPDLGEGIHEGEILKWYVKSGEAIKEDEPLVDVETDKAAVTIPSPKGGTVLTTAGKVGDTVSVGQVMVVIAEEGDTRPGEVQAPPVAGKAETVVLRPTPGTVETVEPQVQPAPGTIETVVLEAVPAAPATRRLAREMAIDVNKVPPTGPGGRVTYDDVMAFAKGGKEPVAAAPAEAAPVAEAPATSAPARAEAEYAAHAASAIPFLDIEPLPDFAEFGPIEKEPLRSIRRRVAHKMVTSHILIADVAHMDEADVTLLEEFRRKENGRRGGIPHLTLLAFLVKAVTAGLKEARSFNASLDPFNEEIIYKKYYNIGVAVDSGKGLVVPVIRDTDRKSIIQIATEIEGVAARARDGKLEVGEMRGGTFTITNIGPIGGTSFIPAINYPEVAILGMGRAQEKPVVRDGQIVIRTILPLTLTFDHRIADGAAAARFVTEMVRHLADPNLLLLET